MVLKTKFIQSAIFLSAMFFFTLFSACDPALLNTYTVENQTQETIQIIVKSNLLKKLPNSTLKAEIQPDSSLQILEYIDIGTVYDKKDDFLEVIDTIYIVTKSQYEYPNIRERKNWSYKILQEGYNVIDKVEYRYIYVL